MEKRYQFFRGREKARFRTFLSSKNRSFTALLPCFYHAFAAKNRAVLTISRGDSAVLFLCFLLKIWRSYFCATWNNVT
jgi:hypothetical protein